MTSHPDPVPWTAGVVIAVFTTAGVALLIASTIRNDPAMGQWGLAAGTVAAVTGVVVICARYTRRIEAALAADREECDKRAMRLADRIAGKCNDETRAIAEEVAATIAEMLREDGAIPMIRR
jgi:hypothetical protein